MGLQDFSRNLRLLCSYGKSVSEVCRKAKLNRQQFNKYLSGTSHPSIANLRRICEFFGVDEYEILLDHKRFREIISVRPPRLGSQEDPLYSFVDGVARGKGSAEPMRRLLGYYLVYCRWHLRDDAIQCSLTRISEHNGVFLTRSIERSGAPAEATQQPTKHHGWAIYSDDRVFMIEQQIPSRRKLFSTMLYAPQTYRFRYLEGLILGIVSDATRQIACYRVVYEYLGATPDLRSAVKQCGVIASDDTRIAPFIREHTQNEMRPGEHVFLPR